MATLNNNQLARLRRTLREESFEPGQEIDFTKTTLNAAFQAVEDWFQTHKAQAAIDINLATAPYVFTNTEKRKIAAAYFELRFGADK